VRDLQPGGRGDAARLEGRLKRGRRAVLAPVQAGVVDARRGPRRQLGGVRGVGGR
jgi:hypothetical protein